VPNLNPKTNYPRTDQNLNMFDLGNRSNRICHRHFGRRGRHFGFAYTRSPIEGPQAVAERRVGIDLLPSRRRFPPRTYRIDIARSELFRGL